MTQDEMMEIFQAAIMLAFKLAVPILLVAMIVGLLIAILQAVFILAPWMTSECIDFVNFIFEKVSAVPIT